MPLYLGSIAEGTQPDAQTSSSAPGPWWKSPYGRWRLTAEDDAMRRRFPGFVLRRREGHLVWVGRLTSGLPEGDEYLVKVTYPNSFPDAAPEVTIVSPDVTGAPHLLSGNRPCLFHPASGPRHGYDPARTTAATLVAWTALWIHAYETWKATGTWPGRQD